ncbi:MAG: hypothetical protein AAFR73_05735 [Pseudomonadota bacterium]
MTPALDPIAAQIVGSNYYSDGTAESSIFSQLINATNWFERCDGAANGDYDCDGHGDEEFPVWTEADGATREMNVTHEFSDAFDLGGTTVNAFDPGGEVVSNVAGSAGAAMGTVTSDDLRLTTFSSSQTPPMWSSFQSSQATAKRFPSTTFFCLICALADKRKQRVSARLLPTKNCTA